jgi:hypothetical protein
MGLNFPGDRTRNLFAYPSITTRPSAG